MRRTAVLPCLLLLGAGVLLAGCPAGRIETTGSEPEDPTSTSGPATTRVLGGTATDADEGDEGDGGAQGGKGDRGSSETTRKSSPPADGDGDGDAGSNKVVLRGSSFGAGSVGDEADGAVAEVTKSIGRPSSDDTSPGANCPGADRYVTWGRFSLTINDDKVIGWGYADSPAGPPHLSTSAGITTGSTLSAVKRAYPDKVTTSPAVESYPASFEVSGVALGGYLTGTSDTSKVTYLFGGTDCGG